LSKLFRKVPSNHGRKSVSTPSGIFWPRDARDRDHRVVSLIESSAVSVDGDIDAWLKPLMTRGKPSTSSNESLSPTRRQPSRERASLADRASSQPRKNLPLSNGSRKIEAQYSSYASCGCSSEHPLRAKVRILGVQLVEVHVTKGVSVRFRRILEFPILAMLQERTASSASRGWQTRRHGCGVRLQHTAVGNRAPASAHSSSSLPAANRDIEGCIWLVIRFVYVYNMVGALSQCGPTLKFVSAHGCHSSYFKPVVPHALVQSIRIPPVNSADCESR